MRTLKRILRAGASFLVVALLTVAQAGSGNSKVGVDKFGADAIRDFALRVNDELDHRQVNLAIVARCGRVRTELPRGITYTHVGFIVFEPVRGEDEQIRYTYVTYNLYQGGEGRQDHSYLKQDVTYDFVAGVAEPDVAVCVPTQVLQKRIIAVIRSPAYRALHIPEYNIVANPWMDRFDNCVTHTLKVCVAAIYETDDRERIYRDIRTYFRPTPVRLGLVKSIGTLFVSGMSTEDEDPSGLQTACYDSLVTFLRENHLVKEEFVIQMGLPTTASPVAVHP